MKENFEEKFEVFTSSAQQTNNFCWTLDKPESTMSLGSRLTKIFPDLGILLLNGPLGAGKTTLTKLLAKHYKWNTHFEDTEENPYLNDFYDDMQRWSFNLQIYFLNSRLNQIMQIRESNKT